MKNRVRLLMGAICTAVLFFEIWSAAAQTHVFKLVTLGDSITKGERKGVEKHETFSALIGKNLEETGIKAEVINVGIGGERTDQAVKRLVSDVIALEPHCVTIMYGTNDAFIDSGKTEPRLPIKDYEKNLRHIILRLRQEGIQPILMTEPPLGRFHRHNEEPYKTKGGNFLMVPYMEACRNVADIMDVPLVDNFRHWTEQQLLGQDIDKWMTDGCHPNPAGHRIIAETILKVLNKNISTMPKGYTVPVIDLAHEKHRQVVIDREPGQYLGHPTTVLLEDNKTMIIVYPKGHGRGAIVMKRSSDGGLTWSERLPVPENWATSLEVPTIYRVIDNKNVRRLIMFSGLYPIRMAVSEDDGFTWTPLEAIGDYGGIVATSDLIRLKDGSYMTLFHDDGRFFHKNGLQTSLFQVYKIISRDGGLTWSDPVVIAEHDAAHLCEPGLIRSPDGSQIAMLFRENSRKFNSFVMFSNDEGESWSEPVELPASLTGDRHKGIYTPDGRIIFVFRDMAHRGSTHGDFVGWVGTYDDIVNRREGQYRIRLMDNTRGADCGYPGLELLPDGTIIATTYGHWTEGEQPYIISVRFTMAELDEKLKALKQ